MTKARPDGDASVERTGPSSDPSQRTGPASGVTVDALSETLPSTDTGDEEHPGPAALGGRYELDTLLGRGAHGDVMRATDRVTGRSVAVKLLRLHAVLDPARLRREVALMRRLRIPGVVRLLDEGTEDERPFVVMDLAEGKPFPGLPLPVAWEELAPAAASLFGTLARMHSQGIVHRDLKPANVLASPLGKVTLLDFGLSRFASSRADGLTPRDGIMGTPAYIAPEQVQGDRVSGQADLYAAGLMLYEALCGRLPVEERDIGRLLSKRMREPATPVAELSPETPAHVAATVDALLAIEPSLRPASAEAVLELLGLQRSPSGSVVERVFASPRASAATEAALRDLFVGRDRLFHEREDAALVLWRRTRGDRERVLAELSAWEQAGVAHRSGDRWVADAEALLAMDCGLWGGGTPQGDALASSRHGPSVVLAELIALVRAGAPGSDVADAALRTANLLAQQGDVARAILALDEGVQALRAEGSRPTPQRTHAAEALLSLWVELAVADATPRALDHVLYELARAMSSEHVARLTTLAKAAVAQSAEPARALKIATALKPFGDAALERARQGLRLTAARSGEVAREEEVLADIEAKFSEVSDDATRAWLGVRRGRVRYRQGRFAEAAELDLEAARAAPRRLDQAIAFVEAAASYLEAFDLERALEVGRESLVALRGLRQPFHEARAEWAIRASLYRLGRTTGADMELADAMRAVDVPYFEAALCLTEAAAAWRAGRPDIARELAIRTANLWERTAVQPDAVVLARALAIATGKTTVPSEIAALRRHATRCTVPGIGIQVLGLLAIISPARPGDITEEDVRAQIAQVPETHHDKRIDVISVAEAKKVLRIEA